MSKTFEYYLYILLFTATGFFAGWVIEKIALKNILKFATKTHWKYDEILPDALGGLVITWTTVLSYILSSRHYLTDPSSIVLSHKISFSIVVISLSILIGRILVGVLKAKIRGTEGLLPLTSIISNIILAVTFLIGILIILKNLGLSITPTLTALGVGGLAIALGLQHTLANLFSGIQVIASKQISTGDFVKLDTGQDGYISDITWRNTTIRTLSNNLIIIPNSKLAAAIVLNYNLPYKEVALLVEVGVSYESELNAVEKVAIETAQKIQTSVKGAVRSFQPFVRYHTFADSSINFTIILRAERFEDNYLVKHEFIKALHAAFKKNSIEIPAPVRTVILKREPDEAIPGL